MTPNITADQRKLATAAWQAAVDRKEASDPNVDAYIERLLQPGLDELATTMINSWAPSDPPQVAALRDQLAEKLQDASPEALEIISQVLS